MAKKDSREKGPAKTAITRAYRSLKPTPRPILGNPKMLVVDGKITGRRARIEASTGLVHFGDCFGNMLKSPGCEIGDKIYIGQVPELVSIDSADTSTTGGES